jgi:type I restriction enzyme S subunit
MREMRDSGIEWVGAIPAAWGVHRIASHFQEIKEKNTANAYSNALQFKMGKIIAKPQKWDEDETNETYSAYTVVHPNIIMINGLNLEFDFVTQRVARVECNGIITSAYIALSPRDDINAEYICYLLKSYDACRAFHSMGRGLRKILSYSELKNKPIVVPPLAEQERIAAFLDAECAEIDAVLEKTRASIEEYKKLKQAVITQAVTKGIRGDRPMKDSGIEWIGDIPAEWRKTQLRHCAAIKSGITLGKKYEKTDSLVERPYLRVANVQDGYVDLSVLTTIEVTQDEDLKYRLRAGDVLMTEGGDRDKLGRGCVWHGEIEPCLHQNHIFAVQTSKETLLPEFLEYLTVSDVGRSYFDVTAIKTTNLACTSSSKVLAFTIPLPSVEEQAEIVEALNTKCAGIDALVAKKQQYLTEIENYKKSLIYEYVTGKKEVV